MADAGGAVVLVERRQDGMARVTLNRPEVRNALDERVIAELTAALTALGADPEVRAVVLSGNGKSFSAGADLAWMRRMAAYGHEENLADALALARLMHTLDTLPKPTLALVYGAAIGGGVGLVACADIAIAADDATFSLSEVKLGLIPAVISPYVVAAIGPRAARRYALTAESFGAAEARRLGLVHEVVPADRMEPACEAIIDRLKDGAPTAQAAAKRLIPTVFGQPIDDPLMRYTAEQIAAARSSEAGREGLAAFFAKRKPAWRTP